MPTIFLVSGSTGETANRVAKAALSQFDQAEVDLVFRPKIRTVKEVRAVVREAKGGNSLIFSTLVDEKLRRTLVTEAHRHGVDAREILGPIVDHVAAWLQREPLGQPGLLARTEEGRLRMIEAVEYAFRHDDGKHVDELNRAEIVLVGLSRSMKTPTTLYLAYRGWLAANVPLILDMEPPTALQKVPGGRVYYLHIEPGRLRELRRSRARRDAIPLEPYASLAHIRREQQHARTWSRRLGWRQIDVSGKSVEEVSREIILIASAAPPPPPARRPK